MQRVPGTVGFILHTDLGRLMSGSTLLVGVGREEEFGGKARTESTMEISLFGTDTGHNCTLALNFSLNSKLLEPP